MECRLHTDDDRIDLAPQAMRLATRGLAGDPLRDPVNVGDPAVERHGRFERDVRPAVPGRRQEHTVLADRLVAQEADGDVDYVKPDYSGRVVLVLGSEGRGVRPRVRAAQRLPPRHLTQPVTTLIHGNQ